MKNLRFLLIATFIFTTAPSVNLFAITIDDVREQKKDDLINCYQEMFACLKLIEEENQRADNRPLLQRFEESLEYTTLYSTGNMKEDIKSGILYKSSVRLRKLKDSYVIKNAKCNYIAREIPKKLEPQDSESISE